MKLHLTTHGIELTPELREGVLRRLRFALSRFTARIARLTVLLSDANGPSGGVDKHCLIRVDAGLPQPVVIRERHENLHAAIASAAERAGRSLERKLRIAHHAADRPLRPRTARL
ncbi:MAG: HPF/RaiA family ribosome-associated protein [Bryobacterales bacterium]|nr:HPF/RaiA family ribosome-associated protein [Bryobacterales bacterium]